MNKTQKLKESIKELVNHLEFVKGLATLKIGYDPEANIYLAKVDNCILKAKKLIHEA